jgi:hypothetical protein
MGGEFGTEATARVGIAGAIEFYVASLRDLFKGATWKVTESVGVTRPKKAVVGHREALGLQM